MRAMWNGQVIAESDDTVVVEGNHYFPRESVVSDYLSDSSKETMCPWKGTASYYTLTVAGQENADAAWCYRKPYAAASNITDRLAFGAESPSRSSGPAPPPLRQAAAAISFERGG